MSRDFEGEGFLRQEPGREFIVEGHGPENTSGLVVFRAVVERGAVDEITSMGTKQGLELQASFDDAQPAFVMLEAVGLVSHVEHLAKGLAALGYHRLPGTPFGK